MQGEVVISGIAGRFPESDSIDEFCNKLYAGEDLVTDDERRWARGALGAPPRNGKLKSLSDFDADFFHVTPNQADVMDPQGRILLEVCYEAILDAGVNPTALRGSRVGVFVAVCVSDTDGYWAANPHSFNKWGCFGSIRALLANRISYLLDFTGPSMTLDTACSSSLYAVDVAMGCLRTGKCDSAIIAGSSVILNPLIASALHQIGATSVHGACRSFDADADGYVRSEAIVAMFLQSADVARRHYATVTHVTTNADGFKARSISFPSRSLQSRLLKTAYQEAGVMMSDVSYIEAHGTGTKAGDPVELSALAEVMCRGRQDPLLVGSVKSNMGHAESASGMCAIAKVILALERGELPPSLHYQKPNPCVPALLNGTIKVVSNRQPWSSEYVGINSFGLGGANAHLILKRPPRQSQTAFSDQDRSIPHMVCVSGRTEAAVQKILSHVCDNYTDVHLMVLLREIHATDIPGHGFRGFVVLPADRKPIISIQAVSGGVSRPLWFVFSGLGSQWTGMGYGLMWLPAFRSAVMSCADVLVPLGIDLMRLLEVGATDDNIVDTFVSIVAIQVGLVATLKTVGIHPDGIIGHSLGEIAAAHADGCLTAEQAVLAAYHRAQCVLDDHLLGNAMIVVGLPAKEAQALAPPELDLACDNAPNSVVFSGPIDVVKEFETVLQKKGVFVRQMATCGKGFHSRYIAAAGPRLLEALEKVIPEPKCRSDIWISSSVPRPEWHSSLARTCSANYLTHNLVSPVHFQDACSEIPNNAIVVEIAPHGVLHSSLCRTLQPSADIISLQARHQDELMSLAIALGKMYCCGKQVNVINLYPPPQFPVPPGTAMISPIIMWNHEHQWSVPRFYDKKWQKQTAHCYTIDLSREEDRWYEGHAIDGRIVLPAAGYLLLVWRSLAANKYIAHTDIPVVFRNVHLHEVTLLSPGAVIQLKVQIVESTGQFVVTNGSSIAVSGEVTAMENVSGYCLPPNRPAGPVIMEKQDAYKDLHLRGYHYNGDFQGVLQVHDGGGIVRAADNWVTLIDSLLQIALLQSHSQRSRLLCLPTKFQQVILNPLAIRPLPDTVLPVKADRNLCLLQCCGIEIAGIETHTIPRHSPAILPLLENMVFMPYNNCAVSSVPLALHLAVQIVLDNVALLTDKSSTALQVVELSEGHQPMLIALAEVFKTIPGIRAELSLISSLDFSEATLHSLKEAHVQLHCKTHTPHLVLTHKLTTQSIAAIKDKGFLMLITDKKPDLRDLLVVAMFILPNKQQILLLRQRPQSEVLHPHIIRVTNDTSFPWLSHLQQSQTNVLLVSQGDCYSGLVGLTKCLHHEPSLSHLRCMLILDPKAPSFSVSEAVYSSQLSLGLAFNVYDNGQWGCYQYLPLEPTSAPSALVEHAYINTSSTGDLSSLQWFQGPALYVRSSEETLCYIYYSALNFHDVMLATGRLPVDALPEDVTDLDCVLGLEFSGRDATGNCVMGMVPARGLATSVVARALWSVPDSWSLEDAATVPVVYCTAYYALIIRGHMRTGESVLIHAGSGGVGLAAITIALHKGCTVYTTVGSKAKRDFLKKQFPQLTDNNIANSRDTTFEHHILRETGGRGVDLILNSLAEDKLQASVRCLTKHGRFLEIGQFDLAADRPLGMGVFLKNVSFHGICLDSVLLAKAHPHKAELMELMQAGIMSGVVKPLPRIVFARDQVEQAFRFMASGQHMGKVLVQVRKEEKTLRCVPSLYLVPAAPRVYFDPNTVCIITGGLGGLGLELAEWLVQRRVTKLILTSRTGLCTGYKAACILRWRAAGVHVVVSTADVTTAAGAAALLDDSNKLGTVTAIFHLAVVLSDGLLQNQTVESFLRVWQSKMVAAQHLDQLSREKCRHLKYFVVFSSASAGRGNPGQSNYGLACSATERLIEERRSRGFPGLAIQWGPIADVGLAAGLTLPPGILAQSVSSYLQTLERFLVRTDLSVVSSLVVHQSSNTKSTTRENIIQSVARVLGVPDLCKVPKDTRLAELGMDSLMQVEIRVGVERHLGVLLSPEEMRNLTVGHLLELSGNKCQQMSDNRVTLNKNKPDTMGFLLMDLEVDTFFPKRTLALLNPKASTKKIPLFVVHAVDGTHKLLTQFGEHMSRPVYVIQFTREAPQTTLSELASFYLKRVMEVQTTGPFFVGGYSLGVSIALEMSLQLEDRGHQVKLVALDGRAHFYRKQATHSILENELLPQIVHKFNPSLTTDVLTAELNSLKTWQDKLELGLQKTGLVGDEKSKLREAVNACHWRIRTVSMYQPPAGRRLQGPVLVVAAAEGFMKQNSAGQYGFSELTDGGTTVMDVNGSHVSFLQGHNSAAVARIVEEWL